MSVRRGIENIASPGFVMQKLVDDLRRDLDTDGIIVVTGYVRI